MAVLEMPSATSGSARTADGSLADLPRDLAHKINDDLLQVLALIHCCRNEILDIPETAPDDGNLHDASTRSVALAGIVEEKVRKVIQDMSPYV